MIRKFAKPTAAVLGAAIWVFSPAMTGHAEPWDAGGPYYWASLLISGFIVGWIEPEKFLTTSLWIVAGQALAILSDIILGRREIGLLIPMGFFALIVLSAPCYAGAFIASRLGGALKKK